MPAEPQETQVAVLALEDAGWLGRWRTQPGVEACEAEGRVWVRGPAHDESWHRLPALERYTSDAEGRLKAPGGRVPLRRLPEGRWQRLEEFLRPRPLAPSLPAQFVAPMAWSLQPSAAYREPALLVLPFPELVIWCDAAAEARLKGLLFALAEDDRACVLAQGALSASPAAAASPSPAGGGVLPTVPGERWCIADQVATPAGWMLPRGITPALVAATLQLAPAELTLVYPDGSAERLPREAFVPLTRAAVRATARV